MALPHIQPDSTSSWKKLLSLSASYRSFAVKDAFKNDPERFKKFHTQNEGLLFDYSKNLVDEKVLSALRELAAECQLNEAIEAMFQGEPINRTENRSVLHVALRQSTELDLMAGDKPVHPLVEEQLSAMENFVNQLHSGSIRGFSGKPITHIVNIGIGGSDLGPAMAAEALTPFRVPGFKVDFLSNVDGAHIRNVLRNCKPETTLFIIASKTFTTQETMMNAHSARQWFLDETQTKPEHVSLHFAAISTNIKLATQFGIRKDYIFGFEDWVGGRYSVWSSIGLSLACYIGFEQFRQFLAGAAAADKHFRNTPYEKNIPVIMALLGIWYRNFLNAESHAILPYYQNLWKFPEWLQQVDMESNGKCVDRNGNRVNYATGPIIWGATGTNGQHAFFQLLHQGTSLIPCDFIGMVHPLETCPKHHQVLLSNFIAQTEALLCGKTLEEVKEEMKASGRAVEDIAFIAPHRVFEGNKPSTTILVPQFDPYYLGMLMAFYEHKVFVQGIIWNIFSFDQWGVELGKVLAGKVLTELQAEEVHASRDSGTAGIMHYVYKQSRN